MNSHRRFLNNLGVSRKHPEVDSRGVVHDGRGDLTRHGVAGTELARLPTRGRRRRFCWVGGGWAGPRDDQTMLPTHDRRLATRSRDHLRTTERRGRCPVATGPVTFPHQSTTFSVFLYFPWPSTSAPGSQRGNEAAAPVLWRIGRQPYPNRFEGIPGRPVGFGRDT